MWYRLQRHDGTDCSATMVPFTPLRMVPIQRYRHLCNMRVGSNPTSVTYSLTSSYLMNRHRMHPALLGKCFQQTPSEG